MLGDGDFCMGATAIWTAARHRIPLLILINNNRSYFNDELHQENGRAHAAAARSRTAGSACAWKTRCPTSPSSPRRRARVGIGPVTKASDVTAAIARGVDVLKKGGVCVIDFHVDPPAERQASHALGHRATGE